MILAIGDVVWHHPDDAAPSEHDRGDGAALASDPNEWGEFAHKPGRRYYSFEEVRQEIVRETERSGS